jgi:cytochrome c oxidase subunit 2|tara:strand:- start:218 stop:1102 length:885 start_codon:yes stop_codon:yes gene_type:complete
MWTGIVFLAVIVGSIAFHVFTPWWWTDIASNWGAMDDTIILTFWIGGGVFILVCLFMVYCIFKFSYKENRKAEYKPEDKKLETRLTWITALGVAALLAPGLLVWNEYIRVPPNAINIEVMAWQWGWKYRLPGEDNKLGTSSVKNISDDNPFGINNDDPHGKDDILIESSELHLEKNRPVKILLRSIDVLHNFYVPQFRAKMDAVPGVITYYWFEPNKNGEYEVLCAEYCGVGHYAMRASVVVQDKKDYKKWLAQHKTFSNYLAEKFEQNSLKKAKIVKFNNLLSNEKSILKESN